MSYWFWIWLTVSVILVIAEMATAGFFMLPFGIGAAIAAVLALLGMGLEWQWAAFVGVSGALLFTLRRFSDRMTHEPPQKVAGDRLLGREGVVIEDIDGSLGTGRVRVDREVWVADAATGAPIITGERVRVIRVVGVHLDVERVEAD